jgi:hypothetical protein
LGEHLFSDLIAGPG